MGALGTYDVRVVQMTSSRRHLYCMPGSRSTKRWCWTLNNYTDAEVASLNAVSTDSVTYLVYGREVGESGTPHLQGYVVLRRRLRLGGVKRLLGIDRGHFEIARGDDGAASDYCKKDNDFVEIGELPVDHSGSRTDLVSMQASIDAGESIRSVAEAHFGTYIRYFRGIERYQSLRAIPRSWRTQVVYFWGPPGSGKTRAAYDEAQRLCGGSVCFVHDQTLQWFNGWCPNTKGVILDDFDGRPSIALLLRLFDRYPLQVPVKGSYLEWNPRIVWITSNYSIDYWYGASGTHYEALLRRIDDVTCLQ